MVLKQRLIKRDVTSTEMYIPVSENCEFRFNNNDVGRSIFVRASRPILLMTWIGRRGLGFEAMHE
jgi:hypothetical protein